MKTLILAVLSTGVLAGAVFCMHRPKVSSSAPVESVAESVTGAVSEVPSTAGHALAAHAQSNSSAGDHGRIERSTEASSPSTTTGLDTAMLNRWVDVLISSQASYGEKQATWRQLRDSGKLDQAVSELEQRMAADPRAAEYPATLGQAYLKKCETLQDVREQGILAMQADKVFDTALALDPSNWEARFTKAVALSYWPATMGKGDEVVQHFQTLIQQQETQTAQPQFAESYALLGDQYQKAGHSDYARNAWERGAELFPNHDGLKRRLRAANTAGTAGTPQ